jgi:AcrR family transcriptional regulator
VYAHYAPRDALVTAVIDRVTAEALDAIDAAKLEDGPAPAPLVRMLDASWQTFERHPLLLTTAASTSEQSAPIITSRSSTGSSD